MAAEVDMESTDLGRPSRCLLTHAEDTQCESMAEGSCGCCVGENCFSFYDVSRAHDSTEWLRNLWEDY